MRKSYSLKLNLMFLSVFYKWSINEYTSGEGRDTPNDGCHDWQIHEIEEEEHERYRQSEKSGGKNYQGGTNGDFSSSLWYSSAVVKGLNIQMFSYEGIQVEDDHKKQEHELGIKRWRIIQSGQQ